MECNVYYFSLPVITFIEGAERQLFMSQTPLIYSLCYNLRFVEILESITLCVKEFSFFPTCRARVFKKTLIYLF